MKTSVKTAISGLLAWLMLVSGASHAEELVVYSGRSDKFVKPVVEAFTAKTGIDVLLHNAESTALLNKLRLEKDRTQADLYLSNDAGNLQKGAELGLFKSLDLKDAEAIPARFRGENNAWLGLSARARVLVVNTDSDLADSVHSVFDLAKPELKGRVGITNSTNESYIAGVTVYMRSAGEDKTRDWLQGLKNNVDGEVFNKHSAIVKAVASGKKAVGLVNHYYIYRHLANEPDAPIRIVLPDQGENGMGIAWNVAGVAMTRYTSKPEMARKFVAFLLSPEGQKIFADVNNEYPTRKGIDAAEAVPPVDSFRVAEVPMSDLGKYRDATIDLIEHVGMP
jgi:iron(III) transport system substrate-binding protein